MLSTCKSMTNRLKFSTLVIWISTNRPSAVRASNGTPNRRTSRREMVIRLLAKSAAFEIDGQQRHVVVRILTRSASAPCGQSLEEAFRKLCGWRSAVLHQKLLEAGLAEHFLGRVHHFGDPVGIKENPIALVEGNLHGREGDVAEVPQKEAVLEQGSNGAG